MGGGAAGVCALKAKHYIFCVVKGGGVFFLFFFCFFVFFNPLELYKVVVLLKNAVLWVSFV